MFRKKKDDDRRDPFDDLFGDFSGIEEMMNELMKNMFRGIDNLEPGKPLVHGYSMRIGPDGKPVINEFGNVDTHGKPKVSDSREPLVDVMESGNEIIVIAELPGVSKSDIELNVSKESMEISVDTPKKKYYKVVELPAEVKEDVDASYNNGILEVKLKRKKETKDKGKKINIK
jgi:HSP20 family protein